MGVRMPWKKPKAEKDPEPSEADRAVQRAGRSLQEAQERGKEVAREAVKMRRIQAENNFARTIERALKGTAR